MNFIGKLMLCCLALALLERIIIAMAIALGLAAIYGLLFRPGDTARLLVIMLMLSHPSWTAVLMVCALCLKVLVDWSKHAKRE